MPTAVNTTIALFVQSGITFHRQMLPFFLLRINNPFRVMNDPKCQCSMTPYGLLSCPVGLLLLKSS